MKQCRKCLENKIETEYRKNSWICRTCHNAGVREYKKTHEKEIKEQKRQWYKLNSDVQKVRVKKWKIENKELDRKQSNIRAKRHNLLRPFKKLVYRANRTYLDKVKPFDLWRLAKKQKCRCYLTGEKLTSKNISLDHILPKSKGGKNEIDNLGLTTWPANQIKNGFLLEELKQFCINFLKTHLPGGLPQF